MCIGPGLQLGEGQNAHALNPRMDLLFVFFFFTASMREIPHCVHFCAT